MSPAPRTAAPWSQTAATTDCHASKPCASSAPSMPASTSPVPAVASAAEPVGLMAVRPSGAAITVPAPLRTTIARNSAASARAAPNAVPLDVVRGDLQQSRGFERMRRQHRRGRALAQRRPQRRLRREEIESVGVDHDGARTRERPRERRRAPRRRRPVRSRPPRTRDRRSMHAGGTSVPAGPDPRAVPARRCSRRRRGPRPAAGPRGRRAAARRPCRRRRRRPARCRSCPCGCRAGVAAQCAGKSSGAVNESADEAASRPRRSTCTSPAASMPAPV